MVLNRENKSLEPFCWKYSVIIYVNAMLDSGLSEFREGNVLLRLESRFSSAAENTG